MKLKEYQAYQQELNRLKQGSMRSFETRLLNGEITCIEPYFDGHLNLQRNYHRLMAEHGLYIEKLIETDDKWVLAELVQHGYAEEHYEEWAKNGEDEVQKALLEKGLYIDILSQSGNEDVQFAIAKQYPKRTLAYIKSLEPDRQRHLGFQVLMYQTQPDIKALKFLFSLDWRKTGYNLQILKGKYKVMCKTPTVIEKTMTPFQLYQTGNPLWKLNLSGYNIASVKQGQYKFDNENWLLTEHDFGVLAKYDSEYWVDFYMDYKKSIENH